MDYLYLIKNIIINHRITIINNNYNNNKIYK